MFQQDAQNGHGGAVHPSGDKALGFVKPVLTEDVLNRPLKSRSCGLESLEPVFDVANFAEIKGDELTVRLTGNQNQQAQTSTIVILRRLSGEADMLPRSRK